MSNVGTHIGRFGVVLVVLIGYATGTARAGIALCAQAAASHLVSPANCRASDSSASVQSLDDLNALLQPSSFGFLGAAAGFDSAPSAEQTAGAPSLRELPPAPSSMALVLSALASLGAYQGARSLKRLHLGITPDWYHTGGPVQVGHATPLDLEFGPPAECVLDEPVRSPVLAYRLPRERCSRLRLQLFLSVESPRGPPLL